MSKTIGIETGKVIEVRKLCKDGAWRLKQLDVATARKHLASMRALRLEDYNRRKQRGKLPKFTK